MDSRTYIILATFNGARFLGPQLDSLAAQTERCWTLIIRDDGSTDNTLEIIQDYCEKDARMFLLDDKNDASGTAASSALTNFSTLLAAAYGYGAEYVFCCDQDDVWAPEKLSKMLTGLRQLEGHDQRPSLVHHDLMVVNESLEPIADSFVELMQLRPADQQNPQRLMSRNEVTGCALACNRALLEIALPISEQAVMHDWWLALSAAFFGRLAYVPEKLVQYRQHKDNTIGAKPFWHSMNPCTNWRAGWRRGNGEFVSTVKQAGAFKNAMAARLNSDPDAQTTLELYSGFLALTRRQRLMALREIDLWRKHWLLNIVLVLRMLLLPKGNIK